MATEVDICNMALSFIGDTATVTSIHPPEGSAQAEHCARFYPMILNEVLTAAPWNFATKRKKLAMLASVVIGEEETKKAFALPADCLKVLTVFSSETNGKRLRYEIESIDGQKAIVTSAEDVYITYVSSSVSEGDFTAVFSSAFAHRLAAALCGPVIPGTTGMSVASEQMKLYETYIATAVSENARDFSEKEIYVSPFIGDCNGEPENVYY